ncbi:mechanosensitive ion channel family protein [Geobacter sp. AOG2]|uniref:mechanosensitive ion channel family protein n=1 Tax=Geobacter sp. AOG2 TaxID=1566347 RepID=UPI001CC800E2|nr:mechanosensitive ion channel domain-containing protein [Geobacter sp. AOG2]GFE60633.1 mechanosensitive ion channel protein MscS [Geobacter sp. AOG2]
MDNKLWTEVINWVLDPTVGKILTVIIGFIIIRILTLAVQKGLLSRIASNDTRYRFRKLANFTGSLAAIILLTIVFSNKLGSLTVAFGVAGAGIAFALQEVIASIAGWVALSFGNFYSVGDRVQLGGITGDVIDIGVLRTTLMETGQWVNADLYNGRIVRVANSFVFKEPVFNYSGDFPFLWDEITVPVKYGSDGKLARKILQKVADDALGGFVPETRKTWHEMVNKYRIENARIEPTVTLIANDNWMEFTVRYVTDFKQRRSTKDVLFTRIMEEFDATEGRVSLASSTFQLVDAPVFNVRMTADK